MLFILLAAMLFLPIVAHAQSGAAIRFVKPADRRNVELGEITVTVEITGVAANENYTWQVLIDGERQGIVNGGTTTNITIPNPSGPHRLKAELYAPDGTILASDEILVLAAPVENHDPIFNRAWFAPLMGVFTITVIGLLILGLRLRPRVST